MNAAWSYSPSGLLLSETTQGSRTTTYTYDGYRRPTTVTDAVGTRSVHYHPIRGVADSVSDPTLANGWLTYRFDARGRLTGPYARLAGSSVHFSRTQVWADTAGGLESLTNTHHGASYSPGVLTQEQQEVQTVLGMTWQEVYAGGAPIVLDDSTTYDGWGRVRKDGYWKNGTVLASDTMGFDARGNLTLTGNGASYDLRDRLTGLSGCTSLTYDDAGNLTAKTCGGVSWSFTYDALDRLTNVSHSDELSRTPLGLARLPSGGGR